MTVSALLKNKDKNILTVLQSNSLQDVCAILAEKRIGVLIVCKEDGVVEGIISERDIVQAIAKSGQNILSAKVAQHMTPDPITCSPLETVNQIMAKMTKGRFRHLPVLEDGKLIGVISIGDIVKARIESMEQEADAMAQYIGG